MKNQTKKTTRPFNIIITAAQFMLLVLAGKHGKHLRLWDDPSIPPIEAKKVGKDMIQITAEDSTVMARITIPTGDKLAGDKVRYNMDREGKVTLTLFSALESENPMMQAVYDVINRTAFRRDPDFILVENGDVSLDGSKCKFIGPRYGKLDKNNGIARDGNIIALYYKNERDGTRITQIYVRPDCPRQAVQMLDMELEEFYVHPTNAFDHLFQTTQPAASPIKAVADQQPQPKAAPTKPAICAIRELGDGSVVKPLVTRTTPVVLDPVATAPKAAPQKKVAKRFPTEEVEMPITIETVFKKGRPMYDPRVPVPVYHAGGKAMINTPFSNLSTLLNVATQ